jgi:hypothetical protein
VREREITKMRTGSYYSHIQYIYIYINLLVVVRRIIRRVCEKKGGILHTAETSRAHREKTPVLFGHDSHVQSDL